MKKNKLARVLTVVLIVGILFMPCVFVINEISDLQAYKNVSEIDENAWNEAYEGIQSGKLSESDYENIFLQTGLGRAAVKKLIETDSGDKIDMYRSHYIKEKKFECVRTGVFACHEKLLDSENKPIQNPPFADLQNGDILVTLSIHSLGWRHGHAAIVVDAEEGTLLQAQMIGEKTNLSSISEWRELPRVAVLRPKNTDPKIIDQLVDFAKENYVGIDYSLFADYIPNNISEETKIPKKTHCANIVKTLYGIYGIDVDSNGGRMVTPNEIFQCENLEIVQIYGNMERI